MKKVLTLIMALVVVFVLSNSVLANPANPIYVDSDLNGCFSFSDCGGGTYSPIIVSFDPGIYKFTADSGYINTTTFGGAFNFVDTYYWSVSIYDPSGAGTLYEGLKNNTAYNNGTQALNAMSGAFVEVDLSSGGDLWLYVEDPSPRDNTGKVTVAYATTVVPEPISSALFLVGGTLLVGRRYIKKKRTA